ncbi:hypothetical protein CCP2SC5_920021 [Azospirillaceae bacterium]
MKKHEILKDLQAVIDSCNEGLSHDWEGSAEGFQAMLELLDNVKKFIEEVKK